MPGNSNSGRQARSVVSAGVQQTLDATASQAALILSRHVHRERGYKNLAMGLQRACEYVIDHAIGKAKQKVEHSGGVLTYGALFKSADEQAKSSPELLIDPTKVSSN